MLKHTPGCLFANKISFVRGLNFMSCWKNCSVISRVNAECVFLFSRINAALMGQAQRCLVYEPRGKVREAARNAMKPRDRNDFPPSFSSQQDALPTAESNRHAGFKISANQSVIFPPSPLGFTPAFRSAAAPHFRGPSHAVCSLKRRSPARCRANTLTPTGT